MTEPGKDTTCVKCGRDGFSGPVHRHPAQVSLHTQFMKGAAPVGWLIYTCKTCGFEIEFTPMDRVA